MRTITDRRMSVKFTYSYTPGGFLNQVFHVVTAGFNPLLVYTGLNAG
jgi:hypothetical protein